MIHAEGSQLRVCGKYLRQRRNKDALQTCRLIILQHVLPDTEELVGLLLEAGAELYCLIGKPYSVDRAVMRRLKRRGIRVLVPTCYRELEDTAVIPKLLRAAIRKSKKDGKQIVIQEVGGYFASALSKLTPTQARFVAGVVEDTTFGLERYQSVVGGIRVPVFSVARSALKEIEARFVGDAAVKAVEREFRLLGASITGRHALVVGYGMIGKNVARALREHNMTVSVYDRRDHRNINAFSVGYKIHKKLELIKQADIIFSATGKQAVSLSDLEIAKDEVVLASVGSQDIEFDVHGLRELAVEVRRFSKHLEKFTLPSRKNVYLMSDGTAVNFVIGSVPSEVIDLVFAEILMCTFLLLKRPDRHKAGSVHPTPETYLNSIAKEWLKFINY